MSIAYNNRATDMILTAFQGVAFRVDGIKKKGQGLGFIAKQAKRLVEKKVNLRSNSFTISMLLRTRACQTLIAFFSNCSF